MSRIIAFPDKDVPMIEVNIQEAKIQLSRLLDKAAAGEEVIIVHSGKPVARIVPIERPSGKRVLGQDAGKVVIENDFDAAVDPAYEVDIIRAGRGRAPRRRS